MIQLTKTHALNVLYVLRDLERISTTNFGPPVWSTYTLGAHGNTHNTFIPKHGSFILLPSYGGRSKKYPEAPT